MLDARQLEALSAVLEHGGFGPAAQALNLSLAAVSLRIKALETSVGQRLLVRGKQVRATPAGQALLSHVRQLRLMEADLFTGLPGGAQGAGRAQWQSLSVAVNADSLATWFLPGVAALLQKHKLLVQVVIDDQDHTHELLKQGEVMACVSTQAQAMRGCLAEPLGVMPYACMASAAVAEKCRGRGGAVSVHRLLAQPAVVFNPKDGLQDAFLEQHFGLTAMAYARHQVPAVDAFEAALAHGLGWGMVPKLKTAQRAGQPALCDLVEVLPGSVVNVALYWHHWERESASAQRLTRAVKAAAAQALAQQA